MAKLTQSNKRDKRVAESRMILSAGNRGLAQPNTPVWSYFNIGVCSTNPTSGASIFHEMVLDREEARKVIDYLTEKLSELQGDAYQGRRSYGPR